jgi:hypothetical protein
VAFPFLGQVVKCGAGALAREKCAANKIFVVHRFTTKSEFRFFSKAGPYLKLIAHKLPAFGGRGRQRRADG